jgi:hypothetical protein
VRTNVNLAALCDGHFDSLVAKAKASEATNRTAAARFSGMADREITKDAPWVGIKTNLSTELVSRRVGNYTYCWLSAYAGAAAAASTSSG